MNNQGEHQERSLKAGMVLVTLTVLGFVIGLFIFSFAIKIQQEEISQSVITDLNNTLANIEEYKNVDNASIEQVPVVETDSNNVTVFGSFDKYYILGENSNDGKCYVLNNEQFLKEYDYSCISVKENLLFADNNVNNMGL